MNQIPIVIQRPLVAPAGSNFEFMHPGVGVKIAQGKKVKLTDLMFEDIEGKSSRAKYLENQEKKGGFQSAMK